MRRKRFKEVVADLFKRIGKPWPSLEVRGIRIKWVEKTESKKTQKLLSPKRGENKAWS